MNVANQFTSLERRVLAVLNEAGEDYFSALLNTILHATGSSTEPERLIAALRNLQRMGMVNCAFELDGKTQRWQRLDIAAGDAHLSAAKSAVNWSPNEELWRWTSDQPRLAIVLTPEGESASEIVLDNLDGQ